MILATGTTRLRRCSGRISPVGTSGVGHRLGGFTLLEMVVVLAIMGLLTTFFAVSFVDSSQDDDLRRVAAELRTAAQKASRLSEAHGGDFYLFLDRSGFGLGENSGVGDFGEITLEHSLPKNIRLKLRRFGDEGWVDPSNFAWGFPANGISEPLDVRLEKGRAYVEMSFNGLTGRVDLERSYYP
jgi:prepilin-type N-terminal cleavage/methylation domain-containing protein